MAYVAGVKNGSGGTEMPVGSSLYGTCATAAATAAKVVTMAQFDKLKTGVTIHVKFTYSNTVASPTLNVNSTGAKAIMRFGTTAPSTADRTSWHAGAVVSFTYDGTYWQMNDYKTGDSDTHYTTHLYAGTGAAANAATTNGNTKLTVVDNTTVRDSITVKGTGATTVVSDANGVVTINSTNTTTGTTYAAASVPNNTTFGTNGSIKAVYDATKHTTATATLAVASWSSNSITVSVTGVTASNLVIVSPAPASWAAWGKAGVYCSAQAAGQLTFTCTVTPTAALTANIIIMS